MTVKSGSLSVEKTLSLLENVVNLSDKAVYEVRDHPIRVSRPLEGDYTPICRVVRQSIERNIGRHSVEGSLYGAHDLS